MYIRVQISVYIYIYMYIHIVYRKVAIYMVSLNLLPEDIVLVEVVVPAEVASSASAAWHLFFGLKIHKH